MIWLVKNGQDWLKQLIGADQFIIHQILMKQGVSAGAVPAGLHKQEYLPVAVVESRRECVYGGRRPLLAISVSILLNLQIFWKETKSFLYQRQSIFILFY